MTTTGTPMPAREAHGTGQASDTTPRTAPYVDPAQSARRALLWYLATGTPHPTERFSWRDVPLPDLVRVLSGLITAPAPMVLSVAWSDIEAAADSLRAVLDDSGPASTAEAFFEGMLRDAVNSAAPDRAETPPATQESA